MMKRIALFGLLASVVMASGCSILMGPPTLTDREVENIKPHPSRNVTIVETWDTYGSGDNATTERKFWYCKQSSDQLQCRPACGEDTRCPQGRADIQASIAPKAAILSDDTSSSNSGSSDSMSDSEKQPMTTDEAAESTGASMTDDGEDASETDDDSKTDGDTMSDDTATDSSSSEDQGGDQ